MTTRAPTVRTSTRTVDGPAGVLRDNGAILLVACYELGHQPLGVALPAGFLARAGFRPASLDLQVEALDEARLARARLVAVAVPMHTALRLGVEVIRRARAVNPSAILVAHGLYAPLHEAHLRRAGADVVMGGEHEQALVTLCERLSTGLSIAEALTDEPALRTDGSPMVRLERLRFPAPLRDGLPPLARYARLLDGDEERLAGYTEASRGCKHRCRHCPLPALYDGRFFVVPVETVVADVRRLVALGARHVTLGDPDFLNGPKHARAVLAALHAEFPALTFDVTAKIEHLLQHRALLPELAANGLLFVVSAVESLSERVLAILDKGHTAADVREALALTRAAGITLRPSLLPFTPWSTREDFLDLVRFVAQEGLVGAVDPVQLSIRLLVPPGSLLERHPDMTPHLRELDEEALTWRWSHPDPGMDALQGEVARLVERAAQSGEPPAETFAAIHALAHVTAGGPLDATAATRDAATEMGRRSPRLSEAWFC